MPKRTDIKSILLIGSGPIVIGQACEFDYSGTQAIKALKEDGYKVILVNSNPATIMTDPEFADRTYIEPITADFVETIIAKERPDAVLPTMGGQTALNVALELAERGVFERYNVQLIGANIESIKTAEDRELFRAAMDEIGIESARSGLARSVAEAEKLAEMIGFPMILRPSRTLGGTGGGIVNDISELQRKVSYALSCSPNHEVLIEESLLGWKEIELEVMRDLKDNVVIICGIENFDPMGVHTGDSITVAPIQTLTDKEYQILRDYSIKVIRKIGVETGGSNVQFALNPNDGRVIIIEMNPRVSRSSALASKATGFPIAKMAAKLAVGYTLDEIPNDITKETPACFEPSIDYVVVKIPRFNFEKFPYADTTLGTQMKSVGEVLSFGRNFREALQKAIRSMELDTSGFDRAGLVRDLGKGEIFEICKKPTPTRLWLLGEAMKAGHSVKSLNVGTGIDPWFLSEIEAIVERERWLVKRKLEKLTAEDLFELKREGFSDKRIGFLLDVNEEEIRKLRKKYDIKPSFRAVDTCASEFVAFTPYLYSTYDNSHNEAEPSDRRKIIILGSGPNRIGQGVEFDYCCVHAVLALKEDGYETIMHNCNPETVSTDYDISDRLYFEPLSFESVMSIVEREKPYGVVVQFGGQTPLKLAQALQKAGVPIIGTSVESIDIAEDRKRFSALVESLKLKQPQNATALSAGQAREYARKIGFPLMIRPSFVLGGRAMRILHSEEELANYMSESVEVSNQRPVLLDRFLDNAIEVDVDAVSDGEEIVIAGIMEHIERAGIHSGDSSCCIPPISLTPKIQDELTRQAKILAKSLNVVGLANMQFAVYQGEIYILEVNPRASRTVPFVSKATGIPWAKVAARIMAGKKLKELGITQSEPPKHISVKAVVFPFSKFSGVDTILGPEMKSTGEVMGIDHDFGSAFAKSQVAAGINLPQKGTVFISVKDTDKADLLETAKILVAEGFDIVATKGTAAFLNGAGIKSRVVNKVRDGSPHIVDLLGEGGVQLVINTPEGAGTFLDSRSIRLVANELRIPTYTTMAAANAAALAIRTINAESILDIKCLQEYHTAPPVVSSAVNQ